MAKQLVKNGRRQQLDQLLVSLCVDFINRPLEQLAAGLNDALRQVTEITGASRTFVYGLDIVKREMALLDVWSRPGLPPLDRTFPKLQLADDPWATQAFESGCPLHVPSIDALPPEAEMFGKRLQQLGVQSYINVPMLFDKQVVGHFGCSCHDHEKVWSEDEITLLRMLGEVMINALKRREAQQALETSERRYRLTIENVEEGMFDWHIPTGVVFISDHMRRSIGILHQDDWSFDQWAQRICDDDRARVLANLNAHLDGHKPVYDAQYRFHMPDGNCRWMHSRGRVVERGPDGSPLRMVGVQRDITEEVERQEEHRRLESHLAHLGRVAAMGETVAGIAHEINQPLHAASTYCAAAREAIRSASGESATKAIELCESAAAQVHRAGEIIHRLREFTRPRPAHVVAVDLNGLVKQAVDFMEQLGKLRGIRLDLDFDNAASIVWADPVQVQQVMVNLLQNACDALQATRNETSTIKIATRHGESFAQVTISDNATVPAPEQPEKLFDAFYTTKDGGMGMGLALCRTILSALGGKIHGEANPHHGMTFRFTLPLDGDPAL